MMTSSYKSILELSPNEAKDYFLENDNYLNLSIPTYYNFEPILRDLDNYFSNNSDLCKFNDKTKNIFLDIDLVANIRTKNINHSIYTNKNNNLSWRNIQLINPILYVYLVRLITLPNNWQEIINRFNEFQSNEKIKCLSIPVKSLNPKNTDLGTLLGNWYKNVEQKSIELFLQYDYLFETDISDCYGSIYTHSIAWAVHEKSVAKQNQSGNSLLGNLIDKSIQTVQYGQTNGIPLGSTLMDFVAEIVLGYADLELSRKLTALNISDYHIIRYRDDYRIFVNNNLIGETILKELSQVLLDLGLPLNGSKTKNSADVITSSIKPDKFCWYFTPDVSDNPQNYLLIIRENSKKFPNSGRLLKNLKKFYDLCLDNNLYSKSREERYVNGGKIVIYDKKYSYLENSNITVLISILIDIIINNSKSYPVGFSILSILLNKIPNSDIKNDLINDIYNKFNKMHKNQHLQIWFKRVLLNNCLSVSANLNEKLCNFNNKNSDIWDISWADISPKNSIHISHLNNFKTIFNKNENLIFNMIEYQKLQPIIQNGEFDIFDSYGDIITPITEN